MGSDVRLSTCIPALIAEHGLVAVQERAVPRLERALFMMSAGLGKRKRKDN